MKIVLAFALLMVENVALAAPPKVYREENPRRLIDSVRDLQVPEGARFSLGLGFASDFRLTGMQAGALTAAWQPDTLGAVARVRVGSLKYAVIQAFPGPTDSTTDSIAFADSGSELNRARFGGDAWTATVFEVMAQVHSRLLPRILPRWTQWVRGGFGYGLYKDTVNSVSFSGIHLVTGGGMQYHLSERSQWAIEGGADLAFGRIGSSTVAGDEGRLPVMWTQLTVGVVYFF